MPLEALGLGLGASIVFALSTLFFKKFAVEVSPQWMNAFKCVMATIAFLIAFLVVDGFHPVALSVVAALALSGLLGLNIGDLFLMRAFRAIGSGRTLMVFSFSPLILAVASYFIFHHSLRPSLLLGVIFLSACILCLGLESFRLDGAWKVSGYIQALLAVVFDAGGIILTRWALNRQPELGLATLNFIRCLGAVLGFAVLNQFFPIHLHRRFVALPPRLRTLVVIVSVTGTFVSLYLWIGALRIGPIAVVAALSASGPLFATTAESISHRRPPTVPLFFALFFFVVGILVINFT